MAALSMHMVPLAEHATLATKSVSSHAPSWAVTSTAITTPHTGNFELPGQRSRQNIFRLPDMGGILHDWLYSRPEMEAIDDEALYKSTTECSTIFRIQDFDPFNGTIAVSPAVSNHWFLVPYQTINQFTVGLCYLDVTYQREDGGDNRVPPLQVGRFAMEDETGEVFACGWRDNIMVVGWIQSVLKCERVRELMLFQAPPDGQAPTNVLLQNSFYERRDCRLCGIGSSMATLPPPCSGISNRLSGDPTAPRPLVNVASLYRRFRGGYFGVVVKTRYAAVPEQHYKELVPVYIDVRHGHFELRKRFTQSLKKNVNLVVTPRRTESLFGISPRTNSRLLLLKTNEPVRKSTVLEVNFLDEDDMEIRISPARRRRRIDGGSASASPNHESSSDSQHGSADSPGRTMRVRNEDDLDRESVLHMRKIRNRESAARANAQRKKALQEKTQELKKLKTVVVPALEERERNLTAENEALRNAVFHSRIYQ